jgi:hypothetical protein
MIIDFRTYTYRPADFYRFLRIYQETGFALTSRWLGTTVGIFTAHSGRANRTLQLFAYRDFNHRDECRAGLRQDGEWQRFIKEAATCIDEQENVILEPQGNNRQWLASASSAQPGNGGVFELRRERTSPGMAPRLSDAWSETPSHDVPASPAQRIVLRPLTGNLDTVYILERFANDAERHDALRSGAGRSPMSATQGEQLLRRSVEAELWVPTEYSPAR